MRDSELINNLRYILDKDCVEKLIKHHDEEYEKTLKKYVKREWFSRNISYDIQEACLEKGWKILWKMNQI